MQETWVFISGSGRSPGGGHGNPLQYSCLENPLGRGAWRVTVDGGHKKPDRTEPVKSCLRGCVIDALCKPAWESGVVLALQSRMVWPRTSV